VGVPDDPILSWLLATYVLGALSLMGYFAAPCRGTDNGAILYERTTIQNDPLKDQLKPNNHTGGSKTISLLSKKNPMGSRALPPTRVVIKSEA